MAPRLTFAMTYCDRDAALAQKSADAVRALYPDASVIVIEDNPRLKLAQFGGQWTERWMQAALATDANIIVKLDPDTRALRTVTHFPMALVFGQMASVGTYHPNSEGMILGGAIGFKRFLVEKIVDSGFLRDAKYTKEPYVREERRFGDPKEMVAMQDPIVHDITQRFGLSEGVWDGLDLMMSWDEARPFRQNATFAHPVRN